MPKDIIKAHIILVWNLNEDISCETGVYGRVIIKYIFKNRCAVANRLDWIQLVSSGHLL